MNAIHGLGEGFVLLGVLLNILLDFIDVFFDSLNVFLDFIDVFFDGREALGLAVDGHLDEEGKIDGFKRNDGGEDEHDGIGFQAKEDEGEGEDEEKGVNEDRLRSPHPLSESDGERLQGKGLGFESVFLFGGSHRD